MNKKWLPEEIEFLKKNYSDMTIEEIGEKIRKSNDDGRFSRKQVQKLDATD